MVERRCELAGEQAMIDYDLFTWSDVQAALQGSVSAWPSGLYSARAYWDEVVVEHAAADRDVVQSWLAELFGPRWQSNDGMFQLRLEAAPGQPPRALDVLLEPAADEKAPEGRARRSFTQPDTAMRRTQWWSGLKPLEVPIIAFHSFKGGVGRTTAALHLARLVTPRERDSTTLLVDMDFEAPGITWMVEGSRLPTPSMAMSDVLTLFHGTPASQRSEIIELVVHKLKNATLGRVYILPAIRGHQRSLDVRPEHLETTEDYTLADVLNDIARGLNADSVIVDLRAGHSELAASLLLDPRIARVLVTTTSGQSIRGTKGMLEELSTALPTTEDDPALTVVVSRLTQPYGDTFARVKTEIIEAIEARSHDSPFPLRFTANLHDEGLLSLPLGWEDASSRIAESSTLEVGDLPVDLTFRQWSEEIVPSKVAPPSAHSADLDEKRARLEAYASELIHAEGSGPGPFLDASFIKKLIGGHRRELPRVVAIGAKGAGKTFTFLRMVGHGTWRAFARAAQVATETDARITPVVWPKNLGDHARAIIDERFAEVGRADTRLLELNELRDAAKRTLSTSTEWRDWWLERLLNAVGASSWAEIAAPGQPAPLFVIDGLEDFLQDVKQDGAEQKCLRALLQEVPTWLKAASSPCGLIVFVRADYVGAAILQNTEQFRAAYQAYDLRWDRHEALRLVQWIAQQAGVLPTGEEQSVTLLKLWGRKLGRDRSREAITENWVLDALSTRQDEVQARDLVRLIAEAANRSRGNDDWTDRLLAPPAIRDALETVGRKKIAEIVEEQPQLGQALERFRVLANTLRIPFAPSELRSNEDQLALVRLEDAGIAWRDRGEVWLVSLYRRGLGIWLDGRRREKVLR
jgi:MinD-like ATPase involved in chromosome partitioning or flagellar assembly